MNDSNRAFYKVVTAKACCMISDDLCSDSNDTDLFLAMLNTIQLQFSFFLFSVS